MKEDISNLKDANSELTNHIIRLEEELRFLKNELSGRTEKNRIRMDRENTEGMNGEGI